MNSFSHKTFNIYFALNIFIHSSPCALIIIIIIICELLLFWEMFKV